MPDGDMLRAVCDENMTSIAVSEMQPGDVLLFRFDQYPQHLAIVGDYPAGGLSIIHAFAQSRKVVEVRLDERWISRIVAAYRLTGVTCPL